MITKHITLDVSKMENQCTINAKYGENGTRKIVISLVNGNTPIRLSPSMQVIIRGRKADNNVIYNRMQVNESGDAEYTLLTDDCSCEGVSRYEVQVINETKVLYSSRFLLDIDGNLQRDDEIESTSSYTALTETMGYVNEKIENLKEKDVTLAINLESAKKEIQEAGNNILAELDEQTREYIEVEGDVVWFLVPEVSSGIQVYTNKLYCSKIVATAKYSSTMIIIQELTSDGTVGKSTTPSNSNELVISEGNYGVVIAMDSVQNDTSLPNDAYATVRLYNKTDYCKALENINRAKEDALSILNGIGNIENLYERSNNLLNPCKFIDNAYVSSSTGVISSGYAFITYEKIPVDASATYTVQKKIIDRLACSMAYYTEDGTFISGESFSTSARNYINFITPENASYVTLSVRKSSSAATYDLSELMMSAGDSLKEYEGFYLTVRETAIKTAVEMLALNNEENMTVSKNILNPDNLKQNTGLESNNGVLNKGYTAFNTYEMLRIKPNTKYILQREDSVDLFFVIVAYYDEEKNYITESRWSVPTGAYYKSFITPVNATYLTVSYRHTTPDKVPCNWKKIMLSEGTEPTDYVPYLVAKEEIIREAYENLFSENIDKMLHSSAEQVLISSSNYAELGITDVRNLKPNVVYVFSRSVTSDMVANLPSTEKRYQTVIKLSPLGTDTYSAYIGIIYEYLRRKNELCIAYDMKGGTDDTSELDFVWQRIQQQELLDLTKSSFAAFQKWAVIGDSLSVGYVYNSDTQTPSGRNLDYSWVQILARKYGNTAVNMGFSGADTRDWFTNKNYGYVDLVKEGNKCQAYVIGLGVNDPVTESFPIGSVDDIGTTTPSFIKQYSKIIQSIKEVNPGAKIFCMTIPNHAGEKRAIKNEAIRTVADYFGTTENVYLVDLADTYYPLMSSTMVSKYNLGSHYTPAGYTNLATINGAILSDVIDNNASDFWNIAFIDYDK